MKKIGMLIAAAVLAMTVTVTAQNAGQNMRNGNKGPREMRMTAQQRADNLALRLNLTEAQKQDVAKLFEKQDKVREQRRAEMQQKHQGMVMDRAQMQDEMKAQRQKDLAAQDAELEKIIGKDKMAQYVQLRQERMDKMKANMNNRKGTKRGNWQDNQNQNQNLQQTPAQ